MAGNYHLSFWILATVVISWVQGYSCSGRIRRFYLEGKGQTMDIEKSLMVKGAKLAYPGDPSVASEGNIPSRRT